MQAQVLVVGPCAVAIGENVSLVMHVLGPVSTVGMRPEGELVRYHYVALCRTPLIGLPGLRHPPPSYVLQPAASMASGMRCNPGDEVLMKRAVLDRESPSHKL